MANKQFSKPFTARTGKDIRQLVNEKSKPVQSTGYNYFTDPAETALAAIWKDLLGHANFNRNDDFFHVGGNSLKAVQMVSRISAHFRVDISLTSIFLQPAIAQIAILINKNQNDKTPLSALIPITERPAYIPLSFNQERLWFIDQMEGSIQYHIPLILNLTGDFDIDALQYAFQNVINRHESLRSVFFTENNNVYQRIIDPQAWQLSKIDGSCYGNNKEELNGFIRQLISQPFDLSEDYMIRASLLNIAKTIHVLVVTMHHIASDGWSVEIIAGEIKELYRAFVQGRQPSLPVLHIQYADFALWQRSSFQETGMIDKIGYWKKRLSHVEPLQFPVDFPRPAVQSTRGTVKRFTIDKELVENIQRLGNHEGATLFMSLLTVFKILLFRYTGQKDICVGTPVAGRQHQEIEALIGFFVNTLALRTNINSGDSYAGLLREVKQTTIEAYEHQEVAFEKVVEVAVTERDMSRSPLFQVLFVLQNTPGTAEIHLPQLEVSGELWGNDTSKFDFSFYLTETVSGIEGFVEYCTDLYQEQTIDRLINHYKELLFSVIKTPGQKIGLLPMLTKYEEHQLIREFNETATPARPSNIVESFINQVAATPHSVAVQYEEEQLTYNELNKRANQLANYLIGKGAKKGMLIPVCIERSNAMIVSILAILKTGAAFVPVDPAYPVERINYMLSDIAASIIISSVKSQIKLQNVQGTDLILIDNHWPLISNGLATNPGISIEGDSLAYVIHTSGSTGLPKGVMIEHHSIANLLECITKMVDFKPTSAFLSVTTFSFDICYLEFFVPLMYGGRLIIVPREVAVDGFQLANSIAKYGATHVQATPVTWQLLLDAGWKNEEQIKMLIGGEAVKEEIKNALTPLGELYNLYGPTETTIWSVGTQLSFDKKVLIGKPLFNTRIYILSDEQQLVPIGVAGEIFIGGAGLAKGYLNQPDLTEQKFVPNPVHGLEGSIIYKTGDVGKWMPDGNLECLGRIDEQVKIRGYRIEPGEIETVLMTSDLVNQAVVIVQNDLTNNKKLIGYFIPEWQEVKNREVELYKQRLDSWKEIYNAEYAAVNQPADAEFDIGIWNDSFTGRPIGDEQMHDWLQDIISEILSEQTGNVLEIGCGTGLIYYRLAGKVNNYTGTDFSSVSINGIKHQIEKGLKNYGSTELKVCAAHEVSLPVGERVDTIIMNSIVQYFPGEQYMNEVMDKCFSLLTGNGRIIIGDVRDNRLLKLFKMRLQLQKMARTAQTNELLWSVQQDVLKEEELCFSPAYFYHLKSRYPRITHIEIKWKNTHNTNELTLYRYTVIIHISKERDLLEPEWTNWNAGGKYIQDLLDANEKVIAVKDVPNFRLWQERLLTKALEDRSASTIEQLVSASATEDSASLQIKALYNIARSKGYHVRLLVNNDPLKVDMVMERTFSGKGVLNSGFEVAPAHVQSFTNIPLFYDISLQLQKDLKAIVGLRLPEYMIPSELIAIRELPLTNNGKVDRRFLSLRDVEATFNKLDYQAPGTAAEQTLVNIWQELLGVSKIGVNDDFFELGGHSLLAMRLISAIRKEMQAEISIKALFNHSTVAKLAAHLEGNFEAASLPPITKHEKPDFIPLSFSQERLWFLDKLEGSIQYHLSAILRLTGKLNQDAFFKAFLHLINRHEILRTVIIEEQGKSYQSVKAADNWKLDIITDKTFRNKEELKEFIVELNRRPFGLSQDYMIRATLIRLDEEEYMVVVTVHHIASDGWSTAILVKELLLNYEALLEGREVHWEPLPVQYADYAIWQRENLQGEALSAMLQYWQKQLEGVATLYLPTDFQRPPVQSKRGALTKFTISKQLTEQLHLLSRQQGATVFMTMLSAFNILMQRYSSQTDICIGTPVANRNRREVEGLIGFFINTLALRTNLNNDSSFTALLQQVKNNMLEAYAHQEVPFEKVVEVAGVERDMSRNPLFQVLFSMQNNPEPPAIQLKGLTVLTEEYEPKTSQLDIICNITETTEGMEGLVEYCTDLFTEDTINRMMAHFRNLLISIVASPQVNISSLQMLNPVEEKYLLAECYGNIGKPQPDETIASLFEKQVEISPDAKAVVYQNRILSFEELDAKANQLAWILKEKGVKAETLVAICMERSPEMLVGILGILKAGGAYVPIDPEYPEDRIQFMLEDSDAAIIISSTGTRSKIAGDNNRQVIILDSDYAALIGQPVSKVETTGSPQNLAYVIYTSGSTGKPKGVMIEQAAIINYLVNNKTHYIAEEVNGAGSFIHLSYTFDASLTAMFMPLINGRLVVISSEKSLEIFEDQNFLEYAPYDFLKITPAHLGLLQHKMQCGKTGLVTKKLVIGGEALFMSQIDQFAQDLPGIEIINEYGPTEAAVGCSTYRFNTLNDNSTLVNAVSIGKPIDNVSMYIIGANNELLPAGAAGEIAIGGAGLARGYLNNVELNKEKFIKDPFSSEDGARIYKTGDIARRFPDGNMEYLGRKDDQVKIRGYRVELGEIEGVLRESVLVKQAVVSVKENGEGNKSLVAYIIPAAGFNKEELLIYARNVLPEFMIPAHWVELESLPLTSNGKIDRRALPDPEVTAISGKEHEHARNDFEETMIAIWQKLLDVDSVSIHDNFFDLGGDSIISIQMVSRARKAGYELQIGDMFSHQTIARLSDLLVSRSVEVKAATDEPTLLAGPCGLLPIQQWFFEKEFEEVSHFNQSVLLAIDKKITASEIQVAFEKLIIQHDALRFRYYKKEEWHQVYNEELTKVSLHTEDLHTIDENTLPARITEICGSYQQHLNIEKGMLMQPVLMQTPASEKANRLLIIIHHLAVDGVSWRILLEDLDHLLAESKIELPAKTASVGQWYEALTKYGATKAVSQSSYWKNVLANYKPLLADRYNDDQVTIKHTGNYSIHLDKLLTKSLVQQVPRVYHTEINDTLLAALAITLTDFNGDDKVVIGLEGHGREQVAGTIDISRTMGWFTSMYPVALRVAPGETAVDSIKSIKEQLRNVPDKGLGFGVLKYINKESFLQGTPAWNVVFNYLGQVDNVLDSAQRLSLATESNGNRVSPQFPVDEKLTLNASIQNGELVIDWTYSRNHFDEKTVIKLANSFIANLELLITTSLKQQDVPGYVNVNTPSDFGLGADISYKELDAFMQEPVNGMTFSSSMESMYRLSSLQQGMLFHGLYDGGAGYINHFWCDLINPDLDMLEKSWKHILKSHTVLRSTFHHDAFSVPVQVVHRAVSLAIEVIDLRNSTVALQQQQLKQFEITDRALGFDFRKGPLMRISLFRLDENRYRMLWSSHHILFDGWSRAVMVGELINVYEWLITGKQLPHVSNDRYEEYIRFIEKVDKDAERAHWKNYLQPVEQSTLLPFISSNEDRNKGIGTYHSVQLELKAEQAAAIEKFAKQNRITINTLMQGVWAYLLHHYTGSDKIVYGVIVSGRPDELPNVEQRIGMFINALPLFSGYNKDQNMVEWLQAIQQDQLTSRRFQFTSLRDIQSWTGIQGDLFDSLLVFENYPVHKMPGSSEQKIKIENIVVQEQTNYPLSLIISNEESIKVDFSYNADLLKQAYVREIRNHFEHVLLQFAHAGQGASLNQFELLTATEKPRLLKQSAGIQANYPVDKTLVDLFEEQVAKAPESIAVMFEDQQLSYRELNERSNQLAHYLQSRGIDRETLVPICLDRSPEMIIGILAILKAGGAYVPIDPEYPEMRISYMLADTKGPLMLTDENTIPKLSFVTNTEIISIDGQWNDISKYPATDLKSTVAPDNLAYVIYTSGSTGHPKGVMNEHAGVVNRLCWAQDYFNLTATDAVLQKTTFSFDVSVWELFWPLLVGSKLVFAKAGGQKDAVYLKDLIAKHHITIMHFVPSMLEAFLAEAEVGACKSLTRVLCSGEALTVTQVNLFNQKFPQVELHNLYGPTEAAIDVTCWSFDGNKNLSMVPIGKPVANTSIYILDPRGSLMPEGCIGEITIGGIQVARGYLNRPDLTAEKFVADPFTPGLNMYRTGDVGRWLPDGNIEYLGRMDEQVKIRGFRIELGEIEAVLRQNESVKQAVVVAKHDKAGNNRLVGYVVPVGNFDKENMVAHLSSRLPDYMVPVTWIVLEELPLTASGKINKKLLPEPDSQNLDSVYTAPRNDLEQKLADIWKEILAVERVGINDNFFELGGHSLSLMRLISSVKRELQVDLTVKIFFELLTIEELANYIRLTQLQTGPGFEDYETIKL